MALIDALNWGEIPAYGEPTRSWPVYGRVGYHFSNDGPTGPDDYEPNIRPALKLKREDDELIIILSAIIKEL
jgi:hypothetical protein